MSTADRDPNPFLDDPHSSGSVSDPDAETVHLSQTPTPQEQRRPVLSRRQPEALTPGDDPVPREDTLVDLDRDQVLSSRAASPAPRPQRRRHWGRWLLAGLLIVALVLGVVGYLAEGEVEKRANATISQSLSDSFHTDATGRVSDPVVLYSLARQRFGEVTFEAPGALVRQGDRELRFVTITGTGRDITHPTDPDLAVIGALDGQAVVSWDELSRLAGVEVQPVSGGRIQVVRPIKAFGATINVQISAVPVLDPATRKVTLQDPQARAGVVPVPDRLIQMRLQEVADQLVLPELTGLRYESMSTNDQGVVIAVAGRDVLLSELGS